MIDTAKNVIAKGTVEHARDAAENALEELSVRLKDAEVVQQLRKKAKKELKHAAKQVKKTQKSRKASKRSRRGPRPLVLLAAVGFVALAAYLVQRRRTSALPEVAPDPFGEAVEEERRAHAFGQRPMATPGA